MKKNQIFITFINNHKQSVKILTLFLVFVITCGFLFSAFVSFSSYKDSFQTNNQSKVALAVVQYHRGRLVRTSVNNEVYEYALTDQDDANTTFMFDDIQPKDIIDYYFYLDSFNDFYKNEVMLKITMNVSVYLKRLKEEVNDENSKSYFVVGNTYMVGDDFNNQTDMKNANLTFFYSKSNYATFDKSDYYSMPRDYAMDNQSLTDEQYKEGNRLAVFQTNNENGVWHKTGFYLNPKEQNIQKSYLLKITLPEQNESSENYVNGRLFIDISIDAQQVQV